MTINHVHRKPRRGSKLKELGRHELAHINGGFGPLPIGPFIGLWVAAKAIELYRDFKADSNGTESTQDTGTTHDNGDTGGSGSGGSGAQ